MSPIVRFWPKSGCGRQAGVDPKQSLDIPNSTTLRRSAKEQELCQIEGEQQLLTCSLARGKHAICSCWREP